MLQRWQQSTTSKVKPKYGNNRNMLRNENKPPKINMLLNKWHNNRIINYVYATPCYIFSANSIGEVERFQNSRVGKINEPLKRKIQRDNTQKHNIAYTFIGMEFFFSSLCIHSRRFVVKQWIHNYNSTEIHGTSTVSCFFYFSLLLIFVNRWLCALSSVSREKSTIRAFTYLIIFMNDKVKQCCFIERIKAKQQHETAALFFCLKNCWKTLCKEMSLRSESLDLLAGVLQCIGIFPSI